MTDVPPRIPPPVSAPDREPATVVAVEDGAVPADPPPAPSAAAPDPELAPSPGGALVAGAAVVGGAAASVVGVAPVAAGGVVAVPVDAPDASTGVVWPSPSAQMAEKSGADPGAGAQGLAGPGSWNRQPSTSPEVTTCSAGPSLA